MKDTKQRRQRLIELLRRRTAKQEKVVSLILVILVLGSSLSLMFFYSRNAFHDAIAANTRATSQAQTALSLTATAAPIQTAASATQNAIGAIITHLTATAIAKVNATAQAEAPATPLSFPPTNRTLVLDDSLKEKGGVHQWGEDNDSTGNCMFTNSFYQIVATSSSFEYCLARATNFTNFIYQVQMTILDGKGGGLIFRADEKGRFYRFLVNQDGSYQFTVFDLKHDLRGTTLSNGANPAINIGLNTPNILAVIVHDNIFELYVNQTRIAVVGDSAYRSGSIGLFAQYGTSLTTAIFQDAKIWI